MLDLDIGSTLQSGPMPVAYSYWLYCEATAVAIFDAPKLKPDDPETLASERRSSFDMPRRWHTFPKRH